MERAAAGLVAGNDDLAALGGEHARRRQVDVAEDDALHATGEEADTRASLAHRGDYLGQRHRRRPARRQLGEWPQEARQRQVAAHRCEREGGAKAPRMREDVEDERANEPVFGRALDSLLDELARLLEQ